MTRHETIGKRLLGGEQEEGTQEDATAGNYSLGFYGDGLSFRGISEVTVTQRSFLVVHTSSSRDGISEEDSGSW